ncbi:MAG: hypothetical protein VXX01_10315, partial [Pseudomonadota bacterium]|nr:hypothetical protein [Pseudomonadota bacterium]
MAIAAFRAGEPEQAADMLVALSGFDRVRGTPFEAEFLSLAGELFDSAGRYDAAGGTHSRALDLAPGHPGHWVNRA